MKKLLLSILLALPMVVSAQVRLGIVNSQDIFNSMPEKATAEAQLHETSEKYKAEYDAIVKEFNQKYADYQELASDPTTPLEIKERRVRELQEGNTKMQNFQQQIAAAIEAQRNELMKPILDKIQQTIEDVSEEEAMAIVFDVAKTPVAYTGSYTEDITPKVKERLGLVEQKQ